MLELPDILILYWFNLVDQSWSNCGLISIGQRLFNQIKCGLETKKAFNSEKKI